MLKSSIANITRSLVALACLVSAAAAQTTNSLAGTTVLIIRHAEKPADGNELTPAGYRRADAYANYFKEFRLNGKPLHLDHIFAAADTKKSERPRLTVEPLSKAIHMPIDQRFKSGDYADLVTDLESHRYGNSILICWHHGKIPDLLTALGANSTALIPTGKWPDETYDWVVEVSFDKDGHVVPDKTHLIHEHLMPTDSK